MDTSHVDYTETWLQAMDTLIAARINGLSYDYTKKCTIVDNQEAGKKIYKVNDGSITFEAYGEANTYDINDIVRVNVPEGKMENDKFITGKWITRETEDTLSTLDGVLDLTGNLFPNNMTNLDINTQMYNTIILSADIVSNNMDKRYGLSIIINQGLAEEAVVSLFSDQMLGNANNFLLPSKQEAVFLINTNNIPYIKSLTWRPLGTNNNWSYSNVYIALGNNNIEFHNIVQLMSSDSLTYVNQENNPKRTLSLLWYNKDNNKYIGYSDGIYSAKDLDDNGNYIYDELIYKNLSEEDDKTLYDNRYCIRWYKKNISAKGDEFMSSGWEYLPELLNTGLPFPEWIDKTSMETKSWPKTIQAQESQIIQTLNTDKTETETFIAILFYNHKKYTSNELIFVNEEFDGSVITNIQTNSIVVNDHLEINNMSVEQPGIKWFGSNSTSDEVIKKEELCIYYEQMYKLIKFANRHITNEGDYSEKVLE